MWASVLGWVTGHWRLVAIGAGVATVLAVVAWRVQACKAVQNEAQQQEVQRLKQEAARSEGRAEAREDTAKALDLVVAPLLDAGAAAAARAEEAKVEEARELERTKTDDVDELVRRLEGVLE